jgi:alkylhydroperoxidase family enzyme
MKQFKSAMVALSLAMAMATPFIASNHLSMIPLAIAQEQSGMDKVSLLLKKLRASMASMKDLDELEKAGMSKEDVDRMRRAMEQKIQQLTDEAIASIHAL